MDLIADSGQLFVQPLSEAAVVATVLWASGCCPRMTRRQVPLAKEDEDPVNNLGAKPRRTGPKAKFGTSTIT